MYSSTQFQNYNQLTKIFISKINTNAVTVLDINDLRDVIRFHEYQYYVANNANISDFDFDILFKQLQQLEATHPNIITQDSPTQRVGNSLNGAFETVPHLVPMLSLNNSYNANDVLDFDRKVNEGANGASIQYCVEPKFDGASISLIYENNVLSRATTRGNGVEGDDITTNIKQIKSIPLWAPFSNFGIETIEIRGEIIMTKKSFDVYNSKLIDQGLPTVANPRNTAAGSLRIKDPKEVANRNLDAFLYHVGYVVYKPNASAKAKSHSQQLQMLWDCGFRSPVNEKIVANSVEEVVEFCNNYEAKRDNLPYEIDGMVIKVDNLDLQDNLGMTSHHPRWAIAYKFKARQAETTIVGIDYQVGRTGAVTPVAKLTPVFLGGVTVSSISIHNQEYIKEKDLKIGDTVLIERAGDVIPQIVKSIVEKRNGSEISIEFPSNCPVCKSQLFKEELEAVWRCINLQCAAQVVEKIIHFTSKDAMDIKSFGDANVRKFYEKGWLQDIVGVYNLPYHLIANEGGYGKKSVDNLQIAIEASKQQPLHRLLYGLGIRFVGENTAKTLSNSVGHLLEFTNKSIEDLLLLDDVGVKVAKTVFDFFRNENNIIILEKLESLGLQLKNEKRDVVTEGQLSGKTFLFTGTLSKLKRADAEVLAESKGGKIVGGVSAKLNYLVVGEDAGSKLEKAKKINTILVLTEDEFLTMIDGA
jgi:DNA ligase (NAD+)